MATFIEIYQLVNNEVFQQKAKIGMVVTALTVAKEAPSTPYHAQRVAYATLCLRLLNTNEDEAEKLTYSVATDPLGADIAAGSDDGVFLAALADVWNAHAGVITSEEA